MSDLGQKSSKFIHYLFYALFFITPLILWPYTSEVFEFNKMMFVYLITILISSAWAIEIIANKKISIVRTPLDIPILLFLTSQIISTIISVNPHTSLWGYYSRFHGGLMSTISYIVLYYALVTHFKDQAKSIKNLLLAITSSAALVSAYAILEHFGIDKNVWVQDVQSRVFSTLGQPNWLSAFLIAILPLTLYQSLNAKSTNSRLINIGLSLLYLIAIIFTKSQSGIAATGVVLLLFFIITSIQKKKSILLLALIPLIALVLIFKGNTVSKTLFSLNKINPFYSDTLTIVTEENKTRMGGTDSMAIRRIVWEGAIKLGLSHPLFGTGVETFGYSYYWVRPAAHNLTSESDFLYNKAHNEYLNFLATTGFFGLITYLLLIGSIIYLFVNKKIVKNEINTPLFLGFISILITNYFGFSVVNVALFFFLFPALYITATNHLKSSEKNINFDKTLFILGILIVSIILFLNLRKAWLGDIAYTKGRASLEEAQKAVKLNPKEPIYYSQLGNINSQVAVQIILPQIKQLPATTSAEVKKQAADILNGFVTDAITNINKAQSLNPYNLNVLKTKAKVEIDLAGIDPKFYQDAINTLLKINELAPTDSSTLYNIGLLYKSLNQKEQSDMAFKKALELKPDFQAVKNLLQAK